MIWSRYSHIIESEKYGYFLFNTMSGAFLHIEKDEIAPFLELKENPDSYMDYENTDFLLEQKFIVENDLDSLACHINEVLRRRYDTSAMSLTIAVTRDCNFNCIYCYETERPHTHMTKEVEDSIVDFIKTNKQIKTLHIVWYGGEPLINYPTIKRLTKKFKGLNINYTAEIVTNGYLLTEAICKEFEELSILRAQITLDGFEEIHNMRRPLKTGGQTYTTILNNICLLLKYNKDIIINIRSNVDRNNQEEYGRFNKYITSYFNDKRVKAYSGFVEDLMDSGCSAAEKNISDHKAKVDFLVSNHKENGIEINLLPTKRYESCIANNFSSFLIDPIGDIYKCWIAMSEPKYKIGNVLDSPNYNEEMNARFICGADYLLDPKCRECSVLPICDGGCTMRRIIGIYNGEKDKCYSHQKESLSRFLEEYYHHFINE